MNQLDHYLWGVVLAYAAFMLAIMTPGPSLMATIGVSMRDGRKAGVAVGAGVVAGTVSWAILAAAGVAALLIAYPQAMNAVRVGAAFYLGYLAYKSFCAAIERRDLTPRSVDRGDATSSYFLRGWTIHLLNPHAVFAWITVISIGAPPGAPAWVVAAIVAGTAAIAVVYYTLFAVAFSSEAVIRGYARVQPWVDLAIGCLFSIVAGGLLLS